MKTLPRGFPGEGFSQGEDFFGRLRHFFMKGVRISIGTGKIVVEFFSVAISVKV